MIAINFECDMTFLIAHSPTIAGTEQRMQCVQTNIALLGVRWL